MTAHFSVWVPSASTEQTDMTPTQTTSAALYVPVSIQDQDQKMQVSELRAYALRKGWVVTEYREAPNRARKRPVFNQMVCCARRQRFDVVLVPTLDCFADSLADLSETLTRLDAWGIRLLAADGRIDTDRQSRAGRAFLKALTVLVKVESKMILRNVRAGIAKAQSNGVHCGRPRLPFPRDRARRLQKQGLSIRAIAARLDIPAATVADAMKRGDKASNRLKTPAFSDDVHGTPP